MCVCVCVCVCVCIGQTKRTYHSFNACKPTCADWIQVLIKGSKEGGLNFTTMTWTDLLHQHAHDVEWALALPGDWHYKDAGNYVFHTSSWLFAQSRRCACPQSSLPSDFLMAPMHARTAGCAPIVDNASKDRNLGAPALHSFGGLLSALLTMKTLIGVGFCRCHILSGDLYALAEFKHRCSMIGNENCYSFVMAGSVFFAFAISGWPFFGCRSPFAWAHKSYLCLRFEMVRNWHLVAIMRI